uniref:PR5 protein n=1 Tax=Lilium hybrid cultivar TaxID=156531 RepID=A0A1Z2RP73_9LILI|nr:PR5 protein [Lilium hybrid cultivar]
MVRRSQLFLATFTLFISLESMGSFSATFTITNNCDYTVWPGILSNAGTAVLATTGFSLNKGESRTLDVPAAWSGRLWGRTLCTTDTTTGNFACGTGDCGSNNIECSGGGAIPPATLAEFTLSGNDNKDFYDVSLVDGYNLPMAVVPQGGGGNNCTAAGCLVQLNGACPAELKVVMSSESVACRSACDAFGSPQYCCKGDYGNSNICKPTVYSEFFKNACPRAYSYAYDDATSTFTCSSGTEYSITFCPSTTREMTGKDPEAAAALPLINDTMVFLGGNQINLASMTAMGCAVPLWLTITLVFATWLLLQRRF